MAIKIYCFTKKQIIVLSIVFSFFKTINVFSNENIKTVLVDPIGKEEKIKEMEKEARKDIKK